MFYINFFFLFSLISDYFEKYWGFLILTFLKNNLDLAFYQKSLSKFKIKFSTTYLSHVLCTVHTHIIL